jgi:hypothetical protein
MVGGMRLIGGTISAGAALVSILSYTTSRAAEGGPAGTRVHRLALAPAPDTVTALGDSIQLAALVTDESGAAVPGAAPTWTSTDPRVLAVDRAGTAVARGPGVAAVVVHVGALETRARIVVLQRPAALVVDDTLLSMDEGTRARPPARVVDARGRTIAGLEPAWRSGDPAVAAVDSAGEIEAVSPGRTVLTATAGTLQATVPLQVAPVPASITVLAGENQRAPAATALPAAVGAQVVSRSGRPVAGVPVRFEPVSGGRADPAVDTSDAEGRVQSVWTLGDTPGRQRLTIAVEGVAAAPTLTAEADPVAGNARMTLVSEEAAGVAGDTLNTPLVIRLADSLGRALADVPVAWSAAEGGTLTPLAARTDSLGEVRAVWRLGPRAGRQRARVQAGNARTLPPLVVTAVARPGEAVGLEVRSGARQNGTVGSALAKAIVVRAVDRLGNGVAGAKVSRAGGPGAAFDGEVTTDSAGQVKLRWTLGREPGAQRLTLRLADDTASATVTAQAAPGAPAALAFVSPPATRSAKALAAPLVVEVTDRFGNPVPGRTLSFRPSSGKVSPARSSTDGRGRAQVRWTLGPKPARVSLLATVSGSKLSERLTLPRP